MEDAGTEKNFAVQWSAYWLLLRWVSSLNVVLVLAMAKYETRKTNGG